ncbi:uncharacterized protein si:cabz01074946.1 isoform X1 [Dicentrarchus labrax]|uniref:Ig-like domain-containing protein n=1 Tax=Dicentrarchus labrax TaxID=13489 RepID=A0A8C4E3G3_DICLA|nr:uncharacterized protein si:cabz01074946.1 isoform X1 [Dicentrarchus labrax]
MQLQILLLHLFQVALVESLEVPGYLGDTVTLPSQANSSWTLSKIEWSVFSNTTWIATYRNGRKVTERFYLYKGRLRLNITSGDLMIRNVNTMDAMEYSVNLINTQGQSSVKKVKLIVKQLPQKPNIENVTTTSTKGGCWVGLICSSPEIGVDLSWKVEPPIVNVFDLSNSGNSALLAFINTKTTHVKFSCISRRATDQTSNDITLKCDDDQPQPGPSPQPQLILHRCRHFAFFIGGILTVLVPVILICCFKEQIIRAWEYVRGKLFSAKHETSA